MMAGAYLWTEYGAGAGWSWMQALGRNSLMVYWVHVMLVYGDIIKPLKRALSVPQVALATVASDPADGRPLHRLVMVEGPKSRSLENRGGSPRGEFLIHAPVRSITNDNIDCAAAAR